MKIKISSIMAFIIYHIIFVKLYYIAEYDLVVYALEGCMAILLLCKYKYFISKRYKTINMLIILFFISILVSSILYKINAFRGIVYALKVLEIFLFWEYIYQRNEQKNVVKIFICLTFIYLLISDFLLLYEPALYLHNKSNYFIGNKFHLSYLHIILVLFYSYYNSENKSIISKVLQIILFAWTIWIAMITQCSTAIIGCALILAYKVFSKRIKTISSPKSIIFTLIISCSVLLLFSGILQIKPVRYLIVNILHEDLTLTGRMYIYENDFDIISKRALFGYGYGNSYDVMYNNIKAPNTQNALLECWLNSGIVGTIMLLLLIYNIFKYYDKNNHMEAIIIYLYVFSILGMIEVTIDIRFIALLAMLNNGNLLKQNNLERKI